ncbi:MAG: hypothetical protein TREMPRED_003961 [Tremellales sp. Tagirdzhanova-0007]|nr:MAG: hypothetical protein TREMPRED_003961 [Tremellales sp. Tagirdzhanova-0007]
MSTTEGLSDTDNSASAASGDFWPAHQKMMKDFEVSTGLGELDPSKLGPARSLDQTDNPVYLYVMYGRFRAEDRSQVRTAIQPADSIGGFSQMQQVIEHLTKINTRMMTDTEQQKVCRARCNETNLKEFQDAFGLDSHSSISHDKFKPSEMAEPFSRLGALTDDDRRSLISIVEFVANKRDLPLESESGLTAWLQRMTSDWGLIPAL